jgi:hypothetical protein
MSDALLTYNVTLEVDQLGNGVYVELGEVMNVPFPELTAEDIDVTHLKSPNRTREFIPGMFEPGEAAIELNWIPGNATDLILVSLRASGAVRNWRVTLPNGRTATFPAYVKGYSPQTPVGDKMSLTATIKMAGSITWTAAAAPVNSLLPSIAGIAQVGQTLTAIEGLWSGGPTFTYQWQVNSGSWGNISGATARTYVPIVGQVSQPIRCIVTGTNSAGNASATSGATAAVIAA